MVSMPRVIWEYTGTITHVSNYLLKSQVKQTILKMLKKNKKNTNIFDLFNYDLCIQI